MYGKILTKTRGMVLVAEKAIQVDAPQIPPAKLVELLQTQAGYFSIAMYFEQQGQKKEVAYQLTEMLNRMHGLGCRYSSYCSFRQMKYRFFACGGRLVPVQ